MTPREHLTPQEIQIATLVQEGLTNCEIGRIIGTSEQVIRNHLPNIFDKRGGWSRLELAMQVAGHGGKNWPGAESTPFAGGHRTVRTQIAVTVDLATVRVRKQHCKSFHETIIEKALVAS